MLTRFTTPIKKTPDEIRQYLTDKGVFLSERQRTDDKALTDFVYRLQVSAQLTPNMVESVGLDFIEWVTS